MRHFISLFLVLILIYSCAVERALVFTEVNQLFEDNAVVEINIPVAQGETELAKRINTKIEDHIANMLNFSEEESDTISLTGAIKNFNNEYKAFKDDFEESALIWEATFDGEVTYNSESVISIAVSSYSNTGGAHGNTNVTFYNFDKGTGKILAINEMINDVNSFKKIAEKHFLSNVTLNDNESYDDYFFGEGFQLPENIGFNDEGLILFYNTYEIAPYAMGITEFTIPFNEIEPILNVL